MSDQQKPIDYARDRYDVYTHDQLADVAAYWRRDAAARLAVYCALYKRAKERGDEDRMAEVYVGHISPTLAAIDAVDGLELFDRCAKCGAPIRPTDVRQAFEGDGDGSVFSYVHWETCRWHPDDRVPAECDQHSEALIEAARLLVRDWGAGE